MCIKIVGARKEVSYDMNQPLEKQVIGCKQIVVDYEPEDPCIDKFLSEIERLYKHGISAKLNIEFNHRNFILGAKTGKQLAKLAKQLDYNEIIKFMVNNHAESDKKLEEIASYCMDGKCRVESKT
jgi:hypothetical protein